MKVEGLLFFSGFIFFSIAAVVYGLLSLGWRGSNRHWHIYEVRGTPGFADGVGAVTRIAPQSFTLRVPRAGFTLVRVRFTPYWRVSGGQGCVMRARDGWTLVYALKEGTVRVDASFDPRRVLDSDPRCASTPDQTGSGS